jgi:hypothetical protein
MIILVDKIPTCNSNKRITFILVLEKSLRCKEVGIGLRVDSTVDFDFNCKV